MLERCTNCGSRIVAGARRDDHGVFCSSACQAFHRHPGFCQACEATTTEIVVSFLPAHGKALVARIRATNSRDSAAEDVAAEQRSGWVLKTGETCAEEVSTETWTSFLLRNARDAPIDLRIQVNAKGERIGDAFVAELPEVSTLPLCGTPGIASAGTQASRAKDWNSVARRVGSILRRRAQCQWGVVGSRSRNTRLSLTQKSLAGAARILDGRAEIERGRKAPAE